MTCRYLWSYVLAREEKYAPEKMLGILQKMTAWNIHCPLCSCFFSCNCWFFRLHASYFWEWIWSLQSQKIHVPGANQWKHPATPHVKNPQNYSVTLRVLLSRTDDSPSCHCPKYIVPRATDPLWRSRKALNSWKGPEVIWDYVGDYTTLYWDWWW